MASVHKKYPPCFHSKEPIQSVAPRISIAERKISSRICSNEAYDQFALSRHELSNAQYLYPSNYDALSFICVWLSLFLAK